MTARDLADGRERLTQFERHDLAGRALRSHVGGPLQRRAGALERIGVPRVGDRARESARTIGPQQFGECVPQGIEDVTLLPRISYELLKAGQSEETVRKVLGQNLLRVFERVEQVAHDLAGEPAWQNDPKTDSEKLAR